MRYDISLHFFSTTVEEDLISYLLPWWSLDRVHQLQSLQRDIKKAACQHTSKRERKITASALRAVAARTALEKENRLNVLVFTNWGAHSLLSQDFKLSMEITC